jgi:hypothetical protein
MAQDFDSTLHDIVYSIDAGTGLKIIRILLYVLVLFIVLTFYTATQFRGLSDSEAMDYAQLGRNYSFKNGLVTKCVRPVTMWKMAERTQGDPRIVNHPDLFHPPAYPVLLSMGFRLFEVLGVDPFVMPEGSRSAILPAEQWVVLPINHFFTILTGFLIFSLGKRLFTREIGLLGMSIYFLSDLVWADSISGLNIPMAAFFSVASFYSMVVAMLNRRDGKSKVRWMLPFLFSVVFSAIAFLTRYITFAIVPGVVLFAWFMGGRFRGGTRFAIVFLLLYALLITPWLHRNYVLCGNPMGMALETSLADTSRYPGHSFDRQLHPEFSVGKAIPALKAKWGATYSEKYESIIPGLAGGFLLSFFVATFFYRFVRPPANHLRWGLGVSILIMLIVAGVFTPSSVRTIHLFWPFIILYGLAFYFVLIDRLDPEIRIFYTALKILIVLLAMFPLVLRILPPGAPSPYPPYYPPLVSKVSGMLNEREVMCTDMPWATAWYGNRVSILLPKTLDDFYEINDYKQYISGMYITTLTKDKPFVSQLLDGPEKSWLPIISGRFPDDFPLKEAISLNRQDQIFLSDRNRWSNLQGAEQK